MVKDLILKFIGKKVQTETGEMTEISRTKLIAVIGVVMFAAETLPKAFGLDFTVPQEVYRLLEMCGLWTLRDSIKK